MQQTKSVKKGVIIGVAVLVVLVAAMAVIWAVTRPETQVGAKTVTVQIVNPKATDRTVVINTDAEYLRGALEEQNLIAGEESAYGLFVKTVDGYTVDDGAQEWWRITKGGADLSTGVDTTPVADGDSFEITMTTGW